MLAVNWFGTHKLAAKRGTYKYGQGVLMLEVLCSRLGLAACGGRRGGGGRVSC